MKYYFVKVAPYTYEVYLKETQEKVNIAQVITERFDSGALKKERTGG